MSVAELADGAAAAPELDPEGRVTDPLLLVDLDMPAGPTLLRAARDAAYATERILVGVCSQEPPTDAWRELLTALDMTLLPQAAVAPSTPCVLVADPAIQATRLQSAAAVNPQAALVLTQVLRAGTELGVRPALDLESFAYSTALGGDEFRRWLAHRGPRPLPPTVETPPVLVERHGDLLSITLNRPERRNAYSRQLRDALVDALRVAVLDESISALTLEGAGPAFCSGGDLDEFGTVPDTTTGHFVRRFAGAAELMHRTSRRTTVRLHGACVGAGIELAAFAGRVVATRDTVIRLPEVGMGLIPGAGGTVSIPRRIGRWRTLYLALSGVGLDAATAARWGLVDELTARP
ncbi:enoyl-CoA hydratase/isomerase family protein [Streptomyces sp. NPDC096311]|uniref:enoyl-CoA hydratase/isomerase family protein n=1 Tax=Streptomyces sp. NPDC096311 TaxID=3366083 RepID=UPI003815DC7D